MASLQPVSAIGTTIYGGADDRGKRSILDGLVIRTLLAIAWGVLLSTTMLHAADWPQWGGTASKNMASPEKGLPETFVPGKKTTSGGGIDIATAHNVKWAVRIGDFACGTPAVAEGKVLIGGMVEGQGVLNCLDEATGKMLWQWRAPCRSDLQADAMNFRHFPKSLGVCSTPVVDGDRLYFVDQNCVVECLERPGPAGEGRLGSEESERNLDVRYVRRQAGSVPSVRRMQWLSVD